MGCRVWGRTESDTADATAAAAAAADIRSRIPNMHGFALGTEKMTRHQLKAAI